MDHYGWQAVLEETILLIVLMESIGLAWEQLY